VRGRKSRRTFGKFNVLRSADDVEPVIPAKSGPGIWTQGAARALILWSCSNYAGTAKACGVTRLQRDALASSDAVTSPSSGSSEQVRKPATVFQGLAATGMVDTFSIASSIRFGFQPSFGMGGRSGCADGIVPVAEQGAIQQKSAFEHPLWKRRAFNDNRFGGGKGVPREVFP